VHVTGKSKTFEINLKVLFFTTKFLVFDSDGFIFSLNGYFKLFVILDVDYLLWLLGVWTRCGN
jgi:hypothetical protein